MSDARLFVLAHDIARTRAVQAVKEAPAGYVVRIEPPKRNGAQNALLHVELSEIAKCMEWAGKKRSIETWKRLLTAAWLRARGESVELLPALDGHGVDVVFRRTSDLDRSECAELTTFIQAWKAEHMETMA